MWWRRQQFLAVAVIFLQLQAVTAQIQYDDAMRPLLGGIMWWSIDPEFNEGAREVQLILLTVFQQHPDCSYVNGQDVVCNSAEGIARRHGEICVKQIREESTTTQILPTPGANPSIERSCVGVENKFKVLSTHYDPVQEQTFERAVNGLQLVIGRISHTVNVSQAATGVLAYLTGPNGTLIHPDQGLLLRQCTRIEDERPCSHNTDAMLSSGAARFGGSANHYWQNFLKSASPADRANIYPIAHGSPALETYVPLCSATDGVLPCAAHPVTNFYSPQIGFPPLIEVAVTPKTTNASTVFAAGAGRYQASTDPVIFKAFDYDGQAMTVYDQQNNGGNEQDRIAKCWSADASVAPSALYRCDHEGSRDHDTPCDPANRGECVGGTCTRRWPSRTCSAPMPLSHRWCLTDADCHDAEANETYACKASWSGCRLGFDVDRNPHQRVGNLVKLDYDWTFYQDRDRYLPPGLLLDNQPFVRSVAPTFMQHWLHVTDAPFLDVDNPSTWDDGAYSDAPGDHVLSDPTPFDATFGKTRMPSVVPAASSIIFATYACDAGTRNQPPRFVTSMEDDAPPQMSTEIECPWYEPCVVDLYAKDFEMRPDGTESGQLTSDRIAIESAFNVKEAIIIAGTEIDCVGREGRDLGQIHCQWRVRHKENPEPGAVGYVPSAIGEMISSCFVALDLHDRCDGSRQEACTCRSMPLCVKIKYTGRPPAFVAPTPLQLNSRDDDGLLVPARTDIPACEGVAIDLTIAATDPDGDLVRIFAYDVDVDALSNGASQHKFLELGGRFQSDFFAADAFPFQDHPDGAACGRFDGFGARKAGDNALQEDIAPSDAEFKSVMSPYRPSISLAPNPRQTIVYTPTVELPGPDPLAGNGLDVVRWEQCVAAAAEEEGEAAMVCREKRSNVDQVICAYAYDNARATLRRWVGRTDPNGDDALAWNRDHSNGDLVSAQHCWRIRMQAPPVFVSDNLGGSSPFNRSWLESVIAGFKPTTGTEAAYKVVRLAVNRHYAYTFVAQDPQPRDKIKILVREDPGVPRDMRVSPSECLPRNASGHPMCRAVDAITDWRAPVDSQVPSECSKATRTIEWTPAPAQAGPDHFRVCLTVRDDSSDCAAIHPDATHTGWYGETLCVLMEVVEPALQWAPDTAAMLAQRHVTAHVGCRSSIVFAAADQSQTIGTQDTNGNYGVTFEAYGDHILERAEVQATPASNPSATPVNWTPQRGEEGRELELCGVARDEFGMRALGLTCRGGPRDGERCGGIRSDDQCGEGGVCEHTSCVMVRVARCRYCARAGDSLTSIVREYAMDMNWLRLWVLNGNRNPEWGTGLKNPDMVAEGTAEQHLFLGVTYRVKPGETLQGLAQRFRTTVKSILMLNFDVDDQHGVQAGGELCILPCSSFDTAAAPPLIGGAAATTLSEKEEEDMPGMMQ